MKNIRDNGNPAVVRLQHEAYRLPEQTAHQTAKKDSIIGLSEELHLKRLTAENKRLQVLVEDLVADKCFQAQRITELNEETVRLKKTLAGWVLEGQN